MKGYTATEVVSAADRNIWEEATALVARLPESKVVRCHELARAVGEILDLRVQDGKFGMVEHSWLWLPSGNILDVYVPGALPMVQLVYVGMPLPIVQAYRPEPERDDVDEEVVAHLRSLMRPRPSPVVVGGKPVDPCPGCGEPKDDGRCLACGYN